MSTHTNSDPGRDLPQEKPLRADRREKQRGRELKRSSIRAHRAGSRNTKFAANSA